MQPILIVPLWFEVTVTLLASAWGGAWLYVVLAVFVRRIRQPIGLTRHYPAAR